MPFEELLGELLEVDPKKRGSMSVGENGCLLKTVLAMRVVRHLNVSNVAGILADLWAAGVKV